MTSSPQRLALFVRLTFPFFIMAAGWFSESIGQVVDHKSKNVESPSEQVKQTPDWVTSMPVSMNGNVALSMGGYSNESLSPVLVKYFWHDRMRWGLIRGQIRRDWDASRFFDDVQVIELCEAIFDCDIPAMERLITAGADVNLVGENGMTPLYWAFHVDDDPRPFGCLLKHGADPNVIARLRGRTEPQAVESGFAVVHLVAKGVYNRHFKNVFEHGGDPNLKNEAAFSGLSPFWMLSPAGPDVAERLQLLIDHGAELDFRNEEGETITSLTLRGGESKYRLALLILKAGADYRLYYSNDGCYFRLIHFLAHAEPKVNERPVEEQKHYRAVVAWLEDHGESLAEAKADLKRWDEWKKDGELGLIEKEHQKRLAQEAEKKQANEKE